MNSFGFGLRISQVRCAAVFVLVQFLAQAAQASPELKGRLVIIGAGEHDKQPVSNGKVTVWEYGNSTITNDEGVFRIALPDGVRGGQEVTLLLDKKDYAIHVPLFGKQRLPEQWSDSVEVRVLPKGSKLFWTDQRIEEFIERAANDSAKQFKQRDNPSSDLGAFILKLGTEYGFTEKEVREHIGAWMKIAKEDTTNFRRRGLAEFAAKRFDAAAQIFDEGARHYEEQASQFYELSGDSSFNRRDFEKALESYQNAIRALSRTSARYMTLTIKLAVVGIEIGIRTNPQRGKALIADGSTQLRGLLAQVDQRVDPVTWAQIQNNLGNALVAQGERVSGKESIRLSDEAVSAYRDALFVFTRGDFSEYWAMTNNNIGLALEKSAQHRLGEESARSLTESIQMYRRALTVYTRALFPQEWALTQNNLGNALQERANHASSKDVRGLLSEAVCAYREALTVRTREKAPQQWALTQNNLGNALRHQAELGARDESVHLLSEAIHAYRLALEVATKDSLPQQWAMTKSSLGRALRDQAERATRQESIPLLMESVKCYRQVLLVYTKDTLPQDWAMTQNGLGGTLQVYAGEAPDELSGELYGAAVRAYRNALTVYTKEEWPERWGKTQYNLGTVLLLQAGRVTRNRAISLYGEAVQVYREALTVITSKFSFQEWAMMQNNLGTALRCLAVRTDGQLRHEKLLESRECLNQALSLPAARNVPQLRDRLLDNMHETEWELCVDSKDWKKAEELTGFVTQPTPRNRRIYLLAARIYQWKQHSFAKAFDLHQNWVKQHPEDIVASVLFAETQLTTRRFEECLTFADRLLGDSKLKDQPSTRSTLFIFKIGCHLALGQKDKASEDVQSLTKLIEQQPEAFRVNWDWSGIRYFLDHADGIYSVESRKLFSALLNAASKNDRNAILTTLRESQQAH